MTSVHAQGYRPDIDGMRALAIIPVLIFHAFPTLMPGGFLGVDIFFVISGFLITGIIRKDIRHRQFTFSNFYARRFRRILPALLIVLSATWLIGWFTLLPSEYKNLGIHLSAGATFTSNIQLLREVGYFDVAAEQKPTLHLWSLGVEEQFYIFWPVILLLISRVRFALILGTLAIALASMFFMLTTTPSAAFYMLPARMWELLIGAGITLLPKPDVLSQKIRNTLSVLATLTVCGLFFYKPSVAALGQFPQTLTAALCAAIIIWSTPSSWGNKFFLSTKPAVFFGKISYPLYLWHWPLLSIYTIYAPHARDQNVDRILLCGASVLLAWITWVFIEKPIQSRFPLAANKTSQTRVLIYATCSLMAILVIGQFTRLQDGFPDRAGHARDAALDVGQGNFVKYVAGMTIQRNACHDMDYAGGQCVATNSQNPPVLAVYGDSHTEHYIPGILAPAHIALSSILLSHSACPPIADIEVFEAGIPVNCAKFNRNALNFILAQPSIKTIALSSLATPYFQLAKQAKYPRDNRFVLKSLNGSDGSPYDLFREGLLKTIDTLLHSGRRVVLLVDIPELPISAESCLRSLAFKRQQNPTECNFPRKAYDDRNVQYRSLIQYITRTRPGVVAFDPVPYICDGATCKITKGNRLLYRDFDHLSPFGSQYISDAFLKWIAHTPVTQNE
ncbi:MAG: acyltransferase family protein [Aquabacterium sp.]